MPSADPPAPRAPVSLVESDAFCDCGYNLHGQVVWRDPSLDLLVCRCPECGRHAAAGRFTGIHSAWLHRLSTSIVVFWALFLLLLFLFYGTMCGTWPAIHLDEMIRYDPQPSTGAIQTPYVYDVRSDAPRDYLQMISVLGGLAILNGFLIGITAAACLWHLRLGAYWFALLPIVAGAVVIPIWEGMRLSPTAGIYVIVVTGSYVGIEAIFALVGVQYGRPVTRGILRVLLPPALLQHLAFLWYRDGKELRLPNKTDGVTMKMTPSSKLPE